MRNTLQRVRRFQDAKDLFDQFIKGANELVGILKVKNKAGEISWYVGSDSSSPFRSLLVV